MKVLLVTNIIYQNLAKSKFTHMAVSGGIVVFIRELVAVIALSMFSWTSTPSFDVNVTITKIVYLIINM